MSVPTVDAPALVRYIRESTGYTQEDIGLLCGMGAKAGRVVVACWEAGTREPNAKQWRILLRIGPLRLGIGGLEKFLRVAS